MSSQVQGLLTWTLIWCIWLSICCSVSLCSQCTTSNHLGIRIWRSHFETSTIKASLNYTCQHKYTTQPNTNIYCFTEIFQPYTCTIIPNSLYNRSIVLTLNYVLSLFNHFLPIKLLTCIKTFYCYSIYYYTHFYKYF